MADMLVPNRIQIETVFGCNASCVMCCIDVPTTRSKAVMPLDKFKALIDSVAPYAGKIEKTDLFGIGEPLLDKTIFDKIAYAKAAGLRSICISTNADLLDDVKADCLLASGIDLVIFSIDGICKETHEAIRTGTSFERVKANVGNFILKRSRLGAATRCIVRFIRQDSNRAEWPEFQSYWMGFINPGQGDQVIAYDVQSWGGKIGVSKDVPLPSIPDGVPCHHVFDRVIVLNDGTVPLCCGDIHRPEHDLGNAFNSSLLAVFNGPKFEAIRELHRKGRRKELRVCRDCTILESEAAQSIVTLSSCE